MNYDVVNSSDNSKNTIKKFSSKSPLFVCVIAYTETCEIPGITIAGANKDLIAYTPAADAEFLYYGYCKSIKGIPATPDGIPTPALITRASLKRGKIPCLIINSGSKVNPQVPYISIGIEHGKNIRYANAVKSFDVKKAFDYGKLLGFQLSMNNDLIVIGESVPGGTTTALGVLTGLGINADYKVSSSMIENPHELKNKIISEAIRNLNLPIAELIKDPLLAISALGDPMMPTVSGIAYGSTLGGSKVMLAGGTQMASVVRILNLLKIPLDNICIGTTSYIMNDKTSNIRDLMKSISDKIPIISIDLGLESSSKRGLNMYHNGIVKEGVGAGGAAISSVLKLNTGVDSYLLLKSIEEEYERSIECYLSSLP